MATTPFVYREAAPGQQAVSYAQMQANADLERNKMVNDMYSNILRNATTQSANIGNMALTRSQMDRDTGRDAQRKLEFDQSMQLERDRIAAIENANKQRNADIQAEKDAEHDRQYDSWLRYAESINARGLQPGERLPAGLIVENGKVVPLMRPRVVATPPGIGSHMDSIDALRQRVRANLDLPPAVPRSAEWVGPPMPAIPRSSELVGPPMPQPVQTEPGSYDEAIRWNYGKTGFSVPIESFVPSDYGPKYVQPPASYIPSNFGPSRKAIMRPRQTDFSIPISELGQRLPEDISPYPYYEDQIRQIQVPFR